MPTSATSDGRSTVGPNNRLESWRMGRGSVRKRVYILSGNCSCAIARNRSTICNVEPY
ncbi:hypothetical protein QUB60_11430 [Microcoleus sp. A2-C5]|uniref:hypothetical protein n=1 Tax=Microcoleus sp. A2-C2 TaxID=2818530 RepID=UPI002FD0F546